jgi:hypothetical protein
MGEEIPRGPRPDPLGGLTNCRYLALERAAIRTRENSMTRSGWKLWASSEEGEGAISLIEISSTVALFRGEGVFLGWPSEKLEAAYRALLPPSDTSDEGPALQQLG